ncbi:MAG: hypothetical protein KAX38_08775, partial [Candidatus Krumholzibacteria bacterium]|nr:hypothetical protein [Candidatus Krumholzibacteria bacterium]
GNPIVLMDFHIFADGGGCWSGPDNLDTEKLFSGFGCGVNIIPLGKTLLKIDYAWTMRTSGRWQFNVGMPF